MAYHWHVGKVIKLNLVNFLKPEVTSYLASPHKSINESGNKTRTTFIIPPIFVGIKTHPSKLNYKKKMLEILELRPFGIHDFWNPPPMNQATKVPHFLRSKRSLNIHTQQGLTSRHVRFCFLKSWGIFWLKISWGGSPIATPLKTNISPENWWLVSFWNSPFFGGTCDFFGGKPTNTQHP